MEHNSKRTESSTRRTKTMRQRKRLTTSLNIALCLVLCGMTSTIIQFAQSFQTLQPRSRLGTTDSSYRRKDPLYIFGRNKDESSSSSETEGKKRKIPFFGRLANRDKSKTLANDTSQQAQLEEAPTTVATATAVANPPLVPEKPKKNNNPTPEDLKWMAEKARLEAERLDAELTLSKIEKLEKQLIRSKKDLDENDTSAKTKLVEDLQFELDILQAKLKGEPVPKRKGLSSSPKDSSALDSSETSTKALTTEETSTPTKATIQLPTATIEEVRPADDIVEIDNAKVLEAAAKVAEVDQTGTELNNIRTEEDLENVPQFLLKILASFVGMNVEPGVEIDKKEFLRRREMIQNLDFSCFEDKEPPVFTASDIRRKKLQILDWGSGEKNVQFLSADPDDLLVVTKVMVEKADGNATQVALYSLQYDYYLEAGGDILSSQPIEELVPEVLRDSFANASFFGQMYPKCVNNRGENKGDDYVSEEPTEVMVNTIAQTILPAVKFSSTAKPYKVPGGYAITGTHKYENGDDLVTAIDAEIAKSRPNLREKLTVLYTPSYGPLTNILDGKESIDSLTSSMEMIGLDEEIFANPEPILFIAGPTLTRDANFFGLVLTSILGLATAWYLSIYPFLLNDSIATRIDADLQLVEANLQPDLSYLTDLSLPLFYTFMALQLVHEFAHSLTAMSKGVKLSVPVFVPSFITGITSTVTTFKTLPKNKNDMFDISAAGPLAGIIVSSLALAIGTKLTIVSDPATLPALPLQILRQSTLGGAIIDQILPGSLYVPEGAPMGGITIPLHPVAIAGYVSLIINALALLPIGTTDGGRLTMALFDRAEKMSIGTLTLGALLWAGLFGSDLFLFYFSFCLAFQTGNEIPARNEQDPVEFSRVLVAIVCYGLAILTLVPVQ